MTNNWGVGRIVGSPLCGLNERICISARKVLDGCVSRLQSERFEGVPISGLAGGYYPPLTFVRAYGSGGSVDGLTVLESQIGSRIRYNNLLPITVELVDANGVKRFAYGTVSIPRDVVLRLPQNGVDYTVESFARLVGSIGSVSVSGDTVSFSCCVAIITRIVSIADVVIPTYGLAVYPECREYGDDLCNTIFNQPPFN